ncbi:MAG: US12 family protein [Polyangiaceae bacterium]|nr:US12 family protein [Myxococcales bacterium]MCB9588253.1 US12 family protein [Polyangiaceae bacterium]
MSGPMTFQVNTGNPDLDQQTLAQYQQSYAAQGMHMAAQPLPGGGFQVTVTPAGAAPAASAPASNKGFGATMPLEAVPEAQAMLAAAHAAQQSQQAPSAPPASPQGYAQQAPAAPAAQWQQQPQAAQGYAQQAAPAPSPAYGQPPAGYGQAAGQAAGGYGQAAGGYAQAAGGYGQAAGAYGAAMGGAMASAGAMAGGAMAMGGGGGFAPAGAPGQQQQGGMVNQLAQAVGAPALGVQRLQYLRKVYGLLTASAFVAVVVGFAAVSLGPTQTMTSPEGKIVQVPMIVGAMLANPNLQYIAFGALFVGTIVASWFSKVKYLNIAALMGVAALMGLEMAPMVFVAQYYAGMGETMSAAPVRDAFLMVLAVFCSMTGYVFVSRKNFSWLGSVVAIGFVVVFIGCIMAFFLGSEPFSLAIATAGAILSTLTLLYVTWYIFRKSEMDDAVGDALALLVQLRNLFMFLLRIFMSNR